jgi:hypothetical protein
MQAPDSGVRIGVRRQAVKFEAIGLVGDTGVHRLELLALQWAIRVDIAVQKRDDDALFLHVAEPELIPG